jgi:hypothetical protein
MAAQRLSPVAHDTGEVPVVFRTKTKNIALADVFVVAYHFRSGEAPVGTAFVRRCGGFIGVM